MKLLIETPPLLIVIRRPRVLLGFGERRMSCTRRANRNDEQWVVMQILERKRLLRTVCAARTQTAVARIDAGTNGRPVASNAQERPNRFWRTAILRERREKSGTCTTLVGMGVVRT